ncbi:MFS transporter [Parablautia muri]|uniref:MFS transporter n=1 Tax=Parablautia muri TaxID=2320879 RepID=A0A9X5GSN3_9FIRM|nr:MFS transporter [Parablautia muri]NBJ93100.1 MFS transporter [Parablautia muri]
MSVQTNEKQDRFPVPLFALFFLFYAGQAIYNTYVNLYLSSVGLSESQIGMTVSISTIGILCAQLFWGLISDRTKTKNSVLQLLYIGAAVIALIFYLNSSFLFLAAAVTLFSVFFHPLMPLQDNFALEYLEDKRWDYGQVRIGGTIGYCLTVLVIGFFLQDNYRPIFCMVAAFLTICRLICLKLPKIEGFRTKENKSSYWELLRNKPLVGLILFNLSFSIGLNFYHNFYAIYFTSDAVGGNSSLVGIMMFASSVSEIPMLILIHRITEKLGIKRTLVMAGSVTALRWLLLFFLKTPALIVPVNLLHGIGYTSFSYCIITYIGKTVPKDMRATGQTLNVLIGNVVSRILFGLVGGFISEYMGADKMMLFSSILIGAGTAIFVIWSRKIKELSDGVSLR